MQMKPPNKITKGCLSLFHHSIDMRTALIYPFHVFVGKFQQNTVFLHEMDKLTAVLMSIE